MLSPLRAASGMQTMSRTPERVGEASELALDRAEGRFRPVDEIHLVDREHQPAHAERFETIRLWAPGMARGIAGLRGDHDQGEIGS